MLTKYATLKEDIKKLEASCLNSYKKIEQHEMQVNSLSACISKTKADHQRELQLKIEQLKKEHVSEVTKSFNLYYDEAQKYKQQVTLVYTDAMAAIDTKKFMDNTDFFAKLDEVDNTLQKIIQAFPELVTDDLLALYAGQGFGLALTQLELNQFTEHLIYFKNYDVFESALGKAQKIENKITDIKNKTVVFVIILLIFGLIMSFKLIFLLAYWLFIVATLSIRLYQFWLYLNLLGAYAILKDFKEEIVSDNNALVLQKCEVYRGQIIDKYNAYLSMIEDIISEMDSAKLSASAKALQNFDEASAIKDAEQQVSADIKNLERSLKDEQAVLENLKEELQQLSMEKKEKAEELERLKKQIKDTYENLEPSFDNLTMLNSFFLGFKEDEPILFEYDSSPSLIFFDSSKNEQPGLMATVKMMCGQIMTAMYPLAYHLTVVDQLTGGVELSAFQVTAINEEDIYESPLFELVTTSTECKHLLQRLYDEFNSRRVKVLGTYESILAYNDAKKDKGARTLPYQIVIFYEYDYKILESDEIIRQLCKVAKLVGIVLIFAIDIAKFEAPNTTGKQEKSLNKVYTYSGNSIFKIMQIISDNCIYKIQCQEDNIDILSVTKEQIIQCLNRR